MSSEAQRELAKLRAKIKRLPQRLAVKAANVGTRAAVKLIVDEARRNVRRHSRYIDLHYGAGTTGMLQKSIIVGKARLQAGAVGSRYRAFIVRRYFAKLPQSQPHVGKRGRMIKARSSPRTYGRMVEYGHYAADGSFVRAYPFMRPAWNRRRDQAYALVRRLMMSELEKAVMEAV
jgi:hypothetical protein